MNFTFFNHGERITRYFITCKKHMTFKLRCPLIKFYGNSRAYLCVSFVWLVMSHHGRAECCDSRYAPRKLTLFALWPFAEAAQAAGAPNSTDNAPLWCSARTGWRNIPLTQTRGLLGTDAHTSRPSPTQPQPRSLAECPPRLHQRTPSLSPSVSLTRETYPPF